MLEAFRSCNPPLALPREASCGYVLTVGGDNQQRSYWSWAWKLAWRMIQTSQGRQLHSSIGAIGPHPASLKLSP